MFDYFTTSSATLYLLLPEIILLGLATLVYIAGAFRPLRAGATYLGLAALVVAAIALFVQDDGLKQIWQSAVPGVMERGPIVVDLFGHTARWAILAVGIILMLLTSRKEETAQRAEEVGSQLLMLAGLMLIAAANELVLLFVGLELVSIPTYVILYVGRNDARGQEAASKYFFLSILSSAVLLYGFSFLYGAAGSTRLEHIAAALSQSSEQAPLNTTLVPIALLLLFAGLAFRLTAVPFHFYAPDVYQGTSNANAGLLSTLPKIAGLLVLARILLTALPGWESLGWKVTLVVSILTMTIGNVLALWQTNVRRLLAYSSIAHAGYILIGLSVALAAKTVVAPALASDPATVTSPAASAVSSSAAVSDANSGAATAESSAADGAGVNGLGASLFYLAVYMFATLGTFAALVYLSRGDRQIDSLDELSGLNRSHPVVAMMVAVFMFSLAGIPPLAGFWGKFTLLYGALTLPEFSQEHLQLRPWFIGLAIVTVLNTAIAAAYYLRVISVMYFRSSESAAKAAATEGDAGRSLGPAVAMVLCAALVLGIGFMPGGILDDAVRAGSSIRQPNVQTAPTKVAAVTKR